ncbi:DUF1120 domain-containing protein [Herbaspirillum chlorophenolicum]|uniref:DUF1120 domain-containing protein n=1 Tax=Herbaspirillum chlorophenolicum TaxID=211589 RepID=UPI0009E38C05|nr:DUF1120 domain-containing protein [Herbaspirillum chlorophenolicum]
MPAIRPSCHSLLRLMLLCAGVAYAGSGGAASMVPMEVVVTLTPAACTPTLSNGGVADYGTMNANILRQGQVTALPAMNMTFSINCDAAAKFSVRVIDNRSASLVPGIVAAGSGNSALGDDYNFGLGIASGRNVGGYTIRFMPNTYTGDYRPVKLMSSTDGNTWSDAGNGAASKRLRFSWGAGNGTVDAYKAVSGSLSVQPYVNKAENLPLSQDIPLDGSATLELHYL